MKTKTSLPVSLINTGLCTDSAGSWKIRWWSCQSSPHHTWYGLNADEPLTNCFLPRGSPRGKKAPGSLHSSRGGVIYKEANTRLCRACGIDRRPDWVSWSTRRLWRGKKRLAPCVCTGFLTVLAWQTFGIRQEERSSVTTFGDIFPHSYMSAESLMHTLNVPSRSLEVRSSF